AGAFEEMVEVSEVLLDVLVTDKAGNVVLDLGPDDFKVVENDQERPVTGVSFYSNRFLLKEGVEGIQHPDVNEVLADRYFILFFQDQRKFGDPSGRMFRRQVEAGKHAQRWVREEMLQGDWVAVAGYGVKLQVYSDFSQNREQLERAIAAAARGKDADNEWASRRPEASADQPSVLAHLPTGKDLRKETKTPYDGLSLLAEATRDILGRKNLMYFGLGFGDLRRAPGGDPATGGFIAREDPRYYPGLEESLNDNNVAVYPIDLIPIGSEHAQRDFLNLIAFDSGGELYDNFVSFLTPMRQIADEANGYYLLSYAAEHPAGETGYRDVAVKVSNPDLVVRSRTGYRYGG
ncbi:MAG: VWA domain-containing protein, partial [Holophagales bacterium]|nr:VWA domain-containing protein [Holophagales bacterium]